MMSSLSVLLRCRSCSSILNGVHALKSPQPGKNVTKCRCLSMAQPAFITSENSNETLFCHMSRFSLVRHLAQDAEFLSKEDKQKFERFSISLDSAIRNRFDQKQNALKNLIDTQTEKPIPSSVQDEAVKELKYRLSKVGFFELDAKDINTTLAQRYHGRIKVGIDSSKYDTICFWVSDKTPITEESKLSSWRHSLAGISKLPQLTKLQSHQFDNVIVAFKCKNVNRFHLKAFRNVPVENLGQLLPLGSTRMWIVDRLAYVAAIGSVIGGALGHVTSEVFGIGASWPLLLSGVAGLAGVQIWTNYRNRQIKYLSFLSKQHYSNGVADNSGLLSIILNKSHDELSKEVLLTYCFLLANQSLRSVVDVESDAGENFQNAASQTSSFLDERISRWISTVSGITASFKSSECLEILRELNILSSTDLRVLPVASAISVLPKDWPTILKRPIAERDLVEGFDRDVNILDENEDNRNKFDWS